MKCRSCDCVLNDFESTRKYSGVDQGATTYVDMCNSCFYKSDEVHIFDFDERDDLNSYEVLEEE